MVKIFLWNQMNSIQQMGIYASRQTYQVVGLKIETASKLSSANLTV